MQKDRNIEEFDLRVREILANAEVKAPRRVKRAVFAQLAPVHPAGGWGVPVFAFAAAAIAALLVLRTPSAEPGLQIESAAEEIVAVVPQQSNTFVTLADIPVLPQKSLGTASQRPEPVKEKALPAVVENQSPEQSTPESEPVQEKVQEPKFEAFDIWEEEEQQQRKEYSKTKIASLHFGGNIASSDSRFVSSGDFSSYSSGYVSSGISENSISSYSIPLSLALEARLPLTRKLSLGAGLQWTMLSRTFEGSYNSIGGEITHTAQYAGIPVSLYFNAVSSPSYMLYAKGGAAFEKCISSNYYMRSQSTSPICSDSAKDIQASVFAGFGLAFKLISNVWLYLDPTLQYYLPSDQPKSVRTDTPLVFNIQGGLKINLPSIRK